MHTLAGSLIGVLPAPAPCSVGALPSNEYWKIGVFFGGLLVFFLLFSLPMSYIKVGGCLGLAWDRKRFGQLVRLASRCMQHVCEQHMHGCSTVQPGL